MPILSKEFVDIQANIECGFSLKRVRDMIRTYNQIHKITLSLNDDKRMQSVDSIKTYPYGTSKDLASGKEEIKCNNIIKQYKKLLTLTMLQKK